MADVLRSTTLPMRTDPLETPTPQTMVPWAEVLAFLHHLEALAAAGTAFQVIETPGQVARRWDRGPCGPKKGGGIAASASYGCQDLRTMHPGWRADRRPVTNRARGWNEGHHSRRADMVTSA